MPNKPTIHILGAGALGSLWATKLSKNNNVTLILRNKPANNTHNFTFIEQDQTTEISLPCESATSSTNTIDTLLVFTKSYDSISAITQLKHRLSSSSKIVLFQNGMGSQQSLIKILPHYRIYAASTTEGANRTNQETIVYAGKGETWLGNLSQDKTEDSSEAEQLATLLSSSTLDVFSTKDIWRRLWIKLAINCAINPFTAILNCKNGEIRDHSFFKSRITTLCQELSSAMKLNTIDLSAREIQTKVEEVLEKTTDNISSMLQDVRAGKQTEIEFINGYIEIIAKEHSLSFSVNAELLEEVRKQFDN